MKIEKGITLIALIITIIVMLILVGVTINIALNGGIFEKAKTATIQTELEQIKEQLTIKKAEIIADNNGNIPSDYGITLSSLDLAQELKTKYANKLIISEDGNLYYDSEVITNVQEQSKYEKVGITKHVENPQEPEDISVAGTYNVHISNMPQIESIVLNDDAGKTGKLNNESITYTYDENLKKVALSIGIELEFKTVGDNKILFLFDNNMCLFLTTNGVNGIATLNGTYGEAPDTITFNQNGTVITPSGEGKYCIIDNYVYFYVDGNFSRMENVFGQ